MQLFLGKKGQHPSKSKVASAATATVEAMEGRTLFSAFTPGDLVVYRVGTGTGALSVSGSNVFLDEYTPAGALVQSIGLSTPTSGNALWANGTATTEGELTLSQNGQHLIVPGYASTVSSGNVNVATTNRVVDELNAAGTIDNSTTIPGADFGTGNIRGATSDNGTNIWATGSSTGVRYTTDGSNGTSVQLATSPTNTRVVRIFNGQLDLATGSSPFVGVSSFSTNLPTASGQTATLNVADTASNSPYDFYFATLHGGTSPDTVYVADDAAGIQKYSLVGGSWVLKGTIGTGTNAVRGLTASVSGTTVTLFATTGASGTGGGGTLYTVTDTAGYNAAPSTTTLTTLATLSGTSDEAFRGVAFVPTAATAAPIVTGLNPSAGGTAGGTTVTINGTGFTGTTAVSFGGTAATSFTVVDDSVITAVVPAHGFGSVDVTVTNANGTSALSAADKYTYAPTITGLSPIVGALGGGTTVVITGTSFTGATAVKFGSTNAASFTVNSDTQITAVSPAGSAGLVDVTVTAPGGTTPTSSADKFDFAGAAVVSSVVDSNAIVASLATAVAYDGGSTPIIITGSNFTGATGVTINGVAATNVAVVSDTQITATTGATADGTYSVTVLGAGGNGVQGPGSGTGSGGSLAVGDTIAAVQSVVTGTLVTLANDPTPPVIDSMIPGQPNAFPSQPGTVNGITYGNWSVFASDGTGAMDIFGSLGSYTPVVGNTISVSGTWSPFNQIPELASVTAISTVATATPPAIATSTVHTLNVNPISNANGAKLFTLTSATITGEGTSFTTANSPSGAKIADSSGSMTLFYWPTSYSQANSFFDGISVPTTPVTITGFVDSFSGTPEFVPMYLNGETPEPFTATASPAPSGIDNFTTVNRGGSVTVTVTRPAAASGDTATIAYSTADESGVAGTDYTAASGTLTFSPGDTSKQFTVTTLNPASTGDKIFTINLGTPTGGAGFLPSYTGGPATVVIHDTRTFSTEANNSYQENATVAVKTGTNPNGVSSNTSTFNIEANNAGNGNFASFGVLDYNDQVNDPSHVFNLTNPIGNINSVEIEVVSTGSSFAKNGPMNVYIVTDTTSSIANATSTLAFDKVDDPTEGLDGQLGTHYLLGTIQYNASQPAGVYTAYNLTTLNATGLGMLEAALSSAPGTAADKFRIVITPGDSVADAALEGSNSSVGLESPIIRVDYSAPSTLPAWLSDPGGNDTWNAGTHTLTVVEASTIIADPGSDEPIIVGSTAAAQLSVIPATSPTDVHIGGVSLSGGAGIDVVSVGGTRSHNNHNVLVIGTLGAASDSTVSVFGTSKINLEDNDLIVHTGTSDSAGQTELATIQALAATGRNVAPGGFADGTWTGNGLTSSAAAAADSGGFELNVLAVEDNSDRVILGALNKWIVGATQENLGANDILVKYTYNGDVALEGFVGDNSAGVVGAFYSPGTTGFNDFAFGDLNGDGKVDDNDAGILSALYGLGTGGANGSQL